jgi:short subunit dehydrogenase-like uncharacterized protein
MPDVLLFGATGYTGRLTAHALARRGLDFVIAGRNRTKLEELARSTGGNPEIRHAEVGDAAGLADALRDVKVMITCVGPFIELGDTAAEAAIRARVHYIDSTGETTFIQRLISDYDERARAAGIAMAPAMGFDEVPADTAATLATQGMSDAELVMTYAIPSTGSRGTVVSAMGIITGEGQWIQDGKPVSIRPGAATRWSPMPPPLGPKKAMGFPLAEGVLAPMHLDLKDLELYVTTGTVQELAARVGLPVLRLLNSTGIGERLMNAVMSRLPEGPDEKGRQARWTILAEALAGDSWRNVAISGADVYGLTAEFLSAGATKMLEPSFDQKGVVSPVQAAGIETWQKEFSDNDVTVEVYEES